MKKTVLVLLLCCCLLAQAENKQVMLMGTFHFENPGLDVVKTDVINVMSKPSQQYLIGLTKRVSQFKPQVVMLEFDPANTDQINQEYQDYLAGRIKLPANETHQIGFRVAKLAGVKKLVSLDERGVQWQGDALFKYMEQHDKAMAQEVQEKIVELTAQINLDQKTLTLEELLIKNNSSTMDRLNKNFYLYTNAVGAGDGFVGADATASWWHRNFRMYAKIQDQAKRHGRVFALAGQGHTAIIRDLLEMDEQLQSVDVLSVLKTP